MNRRWLGCLLGLFCVTTVGYTVSIVAATPEDMIRRPFSCPDQPQTEAKEFQVLSVRKWAQGFVALYRGKCLIENTSKSVLSYRVVKRNGMEWNLLSAGNHISKDAHQKKAKHKDEKPLIEYGVGRAQTKASPTQRKERHTIFYGQVLTANVAAVEVTFNNGKVLRDRGLDGMLLLVAPGATGICDVRILGVDNQILQREELISRQTTSDGNTCQPISGQL
jgi:hypothetical protein